MIIFTRCLHEPRHVGPNVLEQIISNEEEEKSTNRNPDVCLLHLNHVLQNCLCLRDFGYCLMEASRI